MIFLLVLVMIISPYRVWSVESYDNLKIQNVEQGLRESEIHSQRLMSLFVQFQKQYLNFEFKKARSSLEEIVQLKLLKDWNDVERKIFSTSYLRLAQMDELYRHQWIDKFLAFNEKIFIDRDIFPPSFIGWVEDRYQQYQRSGHLWYGQNIPQDVKSIIINGEVFNRLGFSRRIDPDLKYRVTLVRSLYDKNKKGDFISNEGYHFVLILNGRDLMNYSFEILDPQLKVEKVFSNSLSQDVESDLISDKLENAQKQILSDKYKPQDLFQNKNSFERQLKFEGTHFGNESLQGVSSVDMMQQPVSDMARENLKKQPSSPSFFKKHKWFIIIFSSITVGLIVSYGLNKSSSQRQKNQRVTHREDIYY